MTKSEYAAYEQAVANFMEREGLKSLSTVTDEDGESESHFSWSPCVCCGRNEGGEREDCNGYNPTTKMVQDGYAVCMDCVYYAEYGRLDDTTMAEIEK